MTIEFNGFSWPVSDFGSNGLEHESAQESPFPPWEVSVEFLQSYWLGIHPGIDLWIKGSLDQGAPVYAVANGVVTSSRIIYNRDGSRSSWGMVVVIRHEGDFKYDGKSYSKVWSQYAHIISNRVLVKVGDVVRRGQPIAFVGNAEGYYSSPEGWHLHFAIAKTRVLEINPGHWPGVVRKAVIDNYVDPIDFIKANRADNPPLTEHEKFQEAINKLPSSSPVIVAMDGKDYELTVADFRQTQDYTVTATVLNIRTVPPNGAIVGGYLIGARVTILETRDGWGRTDRGWVSMAWLRAA
jgi:hypothetical protein